MSNSCKRHSDDADPHDIGDVASYLTQAERACANVWVVDDVSANQRGPQVQDDAGDVHLEVHIAGNSKVDT